MAKQLIPRPSGLERADLCPGSVAKEAPFPWTDSPAAARGRKMHEAMALLFQVGEGAFDTLAKNPEITEAEMKTIRECYQIGLDLTPDDPGRLVRVEQALELGFLGLSGGKPDLFYISPKYNAAVLIDWKFGVGPVEDPEKNLQMMAYGAGLVNNCKTTKLTSIEPVIIQPEAWKKDDRVRSHVWSEADLNGFIPRIEGIVSKVKAPNAPTIAGPIQCKWCKAKEVCESYKAFSSQQKELKDMAEQTAMNSIKSGTAVTVQPETPLQFPVIVIDEETIALATEKKALALSMRVTDMDTANSAGKLSKDIRGLRNLIDKNREQVKAPILNLGRLIDAEAKKAMTPLDEAAAFLDGQVQNFQRAEADKARKIQEEEERKRREAEAARMAAEAEERRKVEEAQAAARKAQEEALKAENFKTKAAQDKARLAAQVAQEEALKAAREAEVQRQKGLQAERDAQAAESARLLAAQPQAKVAGYRNTVDVTWTIPDYSKIPQGLMMVVLLPNAKVIDQMVKTGALNEAKDGAWISILRTDSVARSR